MAYICDPSNNMLNSFLIPKSNTYLCSQGIRYGGRVTIEEVLDSIFYETKPNTGPFAFTDPEIRSVVNKEGKG